MALTIHFYIICDGPHHRFYPRKTWNSLGIDDRQLLDITFFGTSHWAFLNHGNALRAKDISKFSAPQIRTPYYITLCIPLCYGMRYGPHKE